MTRASKGGEDTAARDQKIGFISVLAFAVGAMVGGGVFTLSGTGIDQAGPAALLSYALAGLIMFVSALAFVAVAACAKEGDSGYGPVAELLGRPWRVSGDVGLLPEWVIDLSQVDATNGLGMVDQARSGVCPCDAGVRGA